MALKENFLNDVFEGNRKYQITKNEDGTYTILDVTEYTQEGDLFGAGDINATNAAVNAHISAKNNPHGVTAEQVGARPNTWMPTASDVGALTWYSNTDDTVYNASTVLEVVNKIPTGGTFMAILGTSLISANDSPMKNVEFHYLVLQDSNGRKRVIAISFSDNNYQIWTRRTFNSNWIDGEWKRLSDEFLSTDGGTLKDGATIHFSGKGTVACGEGYIALMHRYGGNISSFALSEKNDLANAVTFTREGRAAYKIYGTHNITYGTSALTSGSSALTHDCIYQQYE